MNRKKSTAVLALLLSMVFVLTVFAQPARPEGFTPGSHLGVGPGFYGPITVEVTMPASGVISAITVLSHNETHNTGNVPLELYPSMIVDNQSLQVPIVSGATISSMAFMAAVRDAVSRAGADPAQFSGPVSFEAPYGDTSADVVVIGGGGAGLTAAIHAAYEGRNVILVEKTGVIGGTTNYVLEAFGSVESMTHRALGSPLDAETLTQTLIGANPNGIPGALEILAHNNGWAADWLRSIGSPMTVAGGQAAVQTSWQMGEIGVSIVSALYAEARRVGVDIRRFSPATEILMDGNAAAGIRVSAPRGEYIITAPAVIVATGGFAANNTMVAQHRPELAGRGFASAPGATGDGHLMAEAVGAALLNMDHIRINYTYASAPNGYSYYVAYIVNWGGILVNGAGERFMNDQIGHGGGWAALEQGDPLYFVFDNTITQSVREVRKLYSLGMFTTANTVEGLSTLISADSVGLINTIERYRDFVANGTDEDFNRPMLNMSFENPPFHAVRADVRVQGTFGGISTDLEARVLTPEGNIIPGLFAAGEVANEGTWGANPVAVNTVFGRIAGQSAASFVAGR